MNCGLRVASPPPKPLLVYDGDCHFCRLWIHRWRRLTGEAVDFLPAQDPVVTGQFPEIPREFLSNAVQFIATDGLVFSGAEAVFQTLATNPRWQWPLHFYESIPVVAKFSERAYRFVAGNRTGLSYLTRIVRGLHVEPPSYYLVRWWFLRGLGVVYFFAFLSLWMQINGLIGHNGILPVDQFMPAVRQQCEAHGIGLARFQLLPTLCWFDTSNGFIDFQCAAGTILSVLLIAGIAPAPVLFLLWLLYLSLATVGRDFLGFQWDNLLLEAGVLAIFLAPLQLLPGPSRESAPSLTALWLLRLLLFKLMFLSGCVKLLSHDPSWHQLTALTYHYETQPLPTWIGWYAGHLPVWFQKLSCKLTFVIELGAPFLVFLPRRIRCAGAASIVGLEVLILLTGNYTFFNWLTLALCLLCLDDRALSWMLPRALRNRISFGSAVSNPLPRRWTIPLAITLAAVYLSVSGTALLETLGYHSPMPAPFAWMAGELEPFRSDNGYGLFAVMTTQRNEIVIEGSNDGVNWLPYEFKYKPGDLHRRPGFVAPFQPRLDWQMWFAALGTAEENPWFGNFCVRLLQGSPEVLALLAKNPFPAHPPRLIRAELYTYHFTSLAEHRATSDWWKRTPAGEYLPPISLRE